MKKKIALLLIIVMIATFALTGCNMVTINQEKDDAIVVAKISYKGLNAEVTKKDLKQYFNTQGYYLVAYYGMSPQEAFDYCAESLAQTELSRLMALNELAGTDASTILAVDRTRLTAGYSNTATQQATDNITKNIFFDILYADERLQVVKDYNSQMQQLLDNFVKEIEKEQALQEEVEEEEKPEEKPEEEEDTTSKPAIRATRPKPADKVDEIKSDADRRADGTLADRQQELYKEENWLFEYKWEKEASKHTANQIEAKERLDNQLKKVYKKQSDTSFTTQSAYDIIFKDIVDNMLSRHYKLTVVGNNDTAIDNVFDKKVAEIKKSNLESFVIENSNYEGGKIFSESKYKAAITGSSPVLYHPIVGKVSEFGTTGYGYTLNILLKFTEEQDKMLKDFKSIYGENSKEYLDLRESFAKNMTVNISNPNYDAKAKCIDEEAHQKDVDEYGYHKCTNADCPLRPFSEYNVPVLDVLKRINNDLKAIDNTTPEGQVKLVEEFTKWMYKVNDDPGMFSQENAKGYLVPKTGKSDYVKEYTDQSRALMGATFIEGEEPEYKDYNSASGKHFVGSYARTPFESDTATYDSLKDNMFVVTDFGIHIIMISSMPGYYQSTENYADLDSIYSYDREEITTYDKAIRNGIKASVETDIYASNDKVKDLVDNYEDYVEINKKTYEKLVKEASKK